MIDTDKYEGHTKHGEGWKYHWTQGNSGDNWTMLNIKHQDALLLRDAPLLLEEVKRLREAIADIAINMEAADESYMGGFIEDLRKVIE